MNGATEGSVIINRIGNYAVDYRLNPIEDIAAKTKLMPDEFINAESNYVTPLYGLSTPAAGFRYAEAAWLRAPRTEIELKA